MKKWKLSLALLILAALPACQQEYKSETVDKSYQFNVNGCDTGKVNYTSNDDLCAKLQDESLNKFCAQDKRKEMFDQSCGGKAWASGGSYQFTGNGCRTPVITYSGFGDVCAKLRDDELNNFCARDQRYEFFKVKCPTYSWNQGR